MCAACGVVKYCRNVIMLHFKAPVPGTGWGCAACHLPMDGAVAIVCDACLHAPIRYVCLGYSSEEKFIDISEVDQTLKHHHDNRYHPEITARQN